MPQFKYSAKTSDGKDVSGLKEARNVGELVSDLKRSGLIVLNVEDAASAAKSGAAPAKKKDAPAGEAPAAEPKARSKGRRRTVTTRDLSIFCRQLSTMLKAGLSIIDALETIGNETENLILQECTFQMKDDIESGASLSEAVNKHPKVFSLMFRAMIEAGEASGSLTKIVAQLGEYLKKRDKLQKKIKSAMMYPKFVVGFFSVIVAGILLFLVPQFEEMFASMAKPCKRCFSRGMPPDPQKDPKARPRYSGTGYIFTATEAKTEQGAFVEFPYPPMKEAAKYPKITSDKMPVTIDGIQGTVGKCPKCKGDAVTAKLPALTQILLDMSRLVQDQLLIVLASIVALFIIWKKYSSSETGRQQLDRVMLKLPIVGPLVLKSSVARYCMTLSTLLHNGVSLDQSLDIVSRVAGNTVMEEATQQVRELIVQGQGLSVSMAKFPIFPAMVNKMVAIGEESGALAEMLTDIAEFYEEEVNATVEGISTIIEPLMIVVIGAVVCVVVLALYLPIFMVGKSLTAH